MKIMNWQEHAKGRGSGEEEFYVNACCDESGLQFLSLMTLVLLHVCTRAANYGQSRFKASGAKEGAENGGEPDGAYQNRAQTAMTPFNILLRANQTLGWVTNTKRNTTPFVFG